MGNGRILYTEDHDDTRELVVLMLERDEYEVITTQTINDALSLARAQKFDLYLIDSWLVDGEGLDLCRKLREFDGVTPILFYSAAAFETDKTHALQSGAQAYLTKPNGLSELCDTVSRLILSSDGASNQVDSSASEIR